MLGELQRDLTGDLGEEAGGIARLECGTVEVEQREGKAACRREGVLQDEFRDQRGFPHAAIGGQDHHLRYCVEDIALEGAVGAGADPRNGFAGAFGVQHIDEFAQGAQCRAAPDEAVGGRVLAIGRGQKRVVQSDHHAQRIEEFGECRLTLAFGQRGRGFGQGPDPVEGRARGDKGAAGDRGKEGGPQVRTAQDHPHMRPDQGIEIGAGAGQEFGIPRDMVGQDRVQHSPCALRGRGSRPGPLATGSAGVSFRSGRAPHWLESSCGPRRPVRYPRARRNCAGPVRPERARVLAQ